MTRSGNKQTGGKPRDRSTGLRLVATDIDWSSGQGPAVEGPGEAIMMTVTGRSGAIEELSGPGVEMLASRSVA